MPANPIIVIEDDIDDQEILEDVFIDMGINNSRIYLNRCVQAFDYLKTCRDHPLIILCDINLPEMTGLELKQKIDADDELRKRSIPFVFFTTSSDERTITDAYTKMVVQGFFKKPSSLPEIKEILSLIINYWRLSKHPNNI